MRIPIFMIAITMLLIVIGVVMILRRRVIKETFSDRMREARSKEKNDKLQKAKKGSQAKKSSEAKKGYQAKKSSEAKKGSQAKKSSQAKKGYQAKKVSEENRTIAGSNEVNYAKMAEKAKEKAEEAKEKAEKAIKDAKYFTEKAEEAKEKARAVNCFTQYYYKDYFPNPSTGKSSGRQEDIPERNIETALLKCYKDQKCDGVVSTENEDRFYLKHHNKRNRQPITDKTKMTWLKKCTK